MTKPSFVSVIIPVYNRPGELVRAVRSVLNQTFTNFELVVVDDGSNRSHFEARQLLEEEGQRFLSTERSGVSAARNFGVLNSDSKYLAFLDSDDVWFPEKLEKQVAYFESSPEIEICQTEERWIRKGRFVNPKAYHAKPNGEAFFSSLRRCCISPSSVMIKRSLFQRLGGFDERMFVCEDYDLWLRVTARFKVGLLEQALVKKFGGHADQLSSELPAMDRFRLYSLLKLYLSGILNEAQSVAVLKELDFKAHVLLAGALKRSNNRIQHICCGILDSLEGVQVTNALVSKDSRSQLEQCYQLLAESLDQIRCQKIGMRNAA